MKRKIVFISYGDEEYSEQCSRIAVEAESLGVFDKIVVYKPDELPESLTNQEIFKGRKTIYKRGGGYWCWKPRIILEELKKLKDGDIVFYADAGCVVKKTIVWYVFFFLLRFCDAIFFEIGGNGKRWARRSISDYFGERLFKKWLCIDFFLGGANFWKKTVSTMAYLEEWSNLVCNPELVADVSLENKKFERPDFIENRHDQALMTALAYATPHLDNFKLWILPNLSEKKIYFGQVVFAARKSNYNVRSSSRYEFIGMTFLRIGFKIVRWFKNRIISFCG